MRTMYNLGDPLTKCASRFGDSVSICCFQCSKVRVWSMAVTQGWVAGLFSFTYLCPECYEEKYKDRA